jgi:hypothetical protein
MPESDEIELELVEDKPEDETEEESGKLVQFPSDAVRMPEPYLPRPVGRIARGHPLIRPLVILLVLFALVLAGHFVFTLFHGVPARYVQPASDIAREAGSITYEGRILDGWYMDPQREHFLSQDGTRYTYVDSHEREGSRVTGHWRIVQ